MMGYPPQPQGPYEPYGQQPYSGPQPYGYSPPPPPQPPRRNLVVILLFAVGLPLLLLGGCAAVFLVLADSGTSRVTTARDSPILVAPSRAPAATAPDADAESTVQQPQQQEQPPAQQQQEQTAAVGGALTLQGTDPGLQMSVKVDQMVNPATPADDYMKPKTGNMFVAVQVTLTNVGQAVYSDAPTNGALLIDGEGQQYRSTLYSVREGQSLNGSVTINTGDARKGMIVFEVPEGTKLAKLQFALNSGFADQKGEWRLS